MADNEDSKLYIALFPWLAFGHMIPFLEFAKALAKKGHKITFISTPKNINRLPKLPPNLTSLISFISLPLPPVEGLPLDAEATTDLPYNKVQYLKKAYDALKQPLTIFLQSSDIDWIFYDFAPYWLPSVATNLGISHGFFSIFIAAVSCVFAKPASVLHDDRTKPEDFTVPPKWVTFPSKVAFRLFEISKVFDAVTGDASDVSDLFRYCEVLKGSEIVAVRSSLEFEPEWLNLLAELHKKPCLPVGVLPTTEYDGDGEESETWKEVKQWLDKQEKKSVVYVAFGTEAKPSQSELTEIASGLELSGLPFFWVLRKQRGLYDSEVIELPDGFEERTKGRGIVWYTWAPQLKILSHDSIGGFLSHSGWSSVVEATVYERPLILLTFLADQGINASVLVEKKMGYLIPRNEEDGCFTREDVAESLRIVVVKKEGEIYRDKAKEMKLLFADWRREEFYIDKLVDHLWRNRGTSRIK